MPNQMRPFTPTRAFQEDDDDDGAQGYEAMLISALVTSGTFNPGAYGVDADDIVAWSKVWAFADEYQATTGSAPPLSLLQRVHPEFPHSIEVNARWAATQVLRSAAARELRIRTAASMMALREGDVEGAFVPLEGLTGLRGVHQSPANLFDVSKVAAGFDLPKVEVPYPALRRMMNGGLEPTEYLVIAARLAQGKSHLLAHFAAKAIATGNRVAVVSMEMPARHVNMRILKHLCESNHSMFEQLDSGDEHQIKLAVGALGEMTPGELDVFDPSHGRIGTTQMVAELAGEYDVVYIDHLGLMKTRDAKRAIEDWRTQAHISNVIREITLESHSRVVALAQINRSGEHSGSSVIPKASELSQADAIAQDATALITFKRLSKTIIKLGLQKSREGDTGVWYARFDPAGNRWQEMDRQLAIDVSATEGVEDE
jgi:DnaB-like helicase C terminal domain